MGQTRGADVQRMMNEVHFKRSKILADFMQSYLADTHLKQSEVELVQTTYKDRIVWFFQKREPAQLLEKAEQTRGPIV